MLNEWKLIGNSEEKCLPQKVCNCHLTSNPEVFHSLKLYYSLSQSEFTSGTWEENFEEINFADFKFEITHHFLKQEHLKSDQREEPEEGTVILVLMFMEKTMYADRENISYITSSLGSLVSLVLLKVSFCEKGVFLSNCCLDRDHFWVSVKDQHKCNLQ